MKIKKMIIGKPKPAHLCWSPLAPTSGIVFLKVGETCPYCKRYKRPILRAVTPPLALVGGGDSENSAGN